MPTVTTGLATVCYQRDPTAFDASTFTPYDLPQPWGDYLVKNGQNVWSFPLYDNFTWNVPVSGEKKFCRNYWLDLQYVLSWDDATVRQTFDGMCYFKLETPIDTPTTIFDVRLDYELCLYDPGASLMVPQEPPSSSVMALERQLAHVGKLKTADIKEKDVKEELKHYSTLVENTSRDILNTDGVDAGTVALVESHLEALEKLLQLTKEKLKVSEAPVEEDDH
jgi:hypothetical protein